MAHASVPHVMGMYGCAACNAAVLRCRLAPCSVRVVRSVMIRAPRLRQQRAGEPNYPSRGSGHRRAGHNSSVLLGLVCLGLRCADMLGELLCDMRHSTLALQERMEQENKNAYEAFHGLMRGPVDEGAHSTAAVRADAWLDVSEATVPLPALLQLVGPSSAVTSTSTSLHDIVHGGGEFEACECCDPPTCGCAAVRAGVAGHSMQWLSHAAGLQRTHWMQPTKLSCYLSTQMRKGCVKDLRPLIACRGPWISVTMAI